MHSTHERLQAWQVVTTDGFGQIVGTVPRRDVPSIAPPTISGAGATLSTAPDIANFLNLYESYYVKGIKMEFIPRNPNNTGVTNISHVWIALDNNEEATVPTRNIMLDKSDSKVKAMNKSWKLYVPRPSSQLTKNQFVNSGAASTNLIGAYGCIQVYGEGFTAAADIGYIKYTYFVKFWGRRS